jgi:hypothetical protein
MDNRIDRLCLAIERVVCRRTCRHDVIGTICALTMSLKSNIIIVCEHLSVTNLEG